MFKDELVGDKRRAKKRSQKALGDPTKLTMGLNRIDEQQRSGATSERRENLPVSKKKMAHDLVALSLSMIQSMEHRMTSSFAP